MSVVRTKIAMPYLILCEGRDAENFLITYLESDALKYDPRFSNKIQVLNFGGNEQLENYLKNLGNMANFDTVTHIAIIRDAEKDYSKACQDVVRSLKNFGFMSSVDYGKWTSNDNGLNIGYLLFPLNNSEGTLEDLCLQILAEENGQKVLSSVDDFLSLMKKSYGRKYGREHKNKLYTYLSSSDKYVTMPLGTAARAGAFNWNSDSLIPLKTFLADGFDI